LRAGGGGVNLFNSQGNPWTADYLKITGELDVDLRSNIAAEARSQPVFILAAGTVQRSASQSTSLHSISLIMPGNGQRIEAQGKANNVTKSRSRPRRADELEHARRRLRES
jgi:hypothetical protein